MNRTELYRNGFKKNPFFCESSSVIQIVFNKSSMVQFG